MELLLKAQKNNESVRIPLYKEEDENASAMGKKIFVYYDFEYNAFSLRGSDGFVSEFYINDEKQTINRITSLNKSQKNKYQNEYQFIFDKNAEKNKNYKKIFMYCFGIVQIKVKISGIYYVSDSISIMVTEDTQYQNITNMLDYIYDKGNDYLYENYVSLENNDNNDNIKAESKLKFIEDVIEIYEHFSSYFQNSPKTKATSGEVVGKFYKLDSVTPKTIQYIAFHPEELYEVDFNTGISYGKRHFQPENTLISSTVYTSDVYENRVITGFLSTLIVALENMKYDENEDNVYRNGNYIESTKYIYRMHTMSVEECKERLQILLFRYRKMLGVNDIYMDFLPEYTDTFRLVVPYRAVYQKIYEWYQDEGYSTAKSQLLQSFISTRRTTSIIYEYYCLIKMLVTIREEMNCTFVEYKTERFEYKTTNSLQNTYCNNTFFFTGNDGSEITLYFQPVIYGDISYPRPNDIMLYRNRSMSMAGGNKGNIYTPDYLLKINRDGSSRYIIMDAKFSSMQTVENELLAELVYKYLFSVSEIEDKDSIDGMIILCGKDAPKNQVCNLHDISGKMNKSVKPFSYIVDLSGADIGDNAVIKDMFSQLLR
ncbi:MAG: hypothetical protein K2K66_00025 [Ruminococcus sp.]|nr:hypothetical protein [Ruminococcus sp.]